MPLVRHSSVEHWGHYSLQEHYWFAAGAGLVSYIVAAAAVHAMVASCG